MEEAAHGIQIVAIGASTGGPVPVKTILSVLSADFPAPVVVVQHISPGFTPNYVQWLSAGSKLPVHLAVDGQPIEAGHVYVAPDGIHMGIGVQNRIELTMAEQEHGVRPSVSFLFRSVLRTFGGNVVGILLSGMGKDGAAELRALRDAGAVTFAQNRETCVVFGMPGEAVKNKAAVHVLPPELIGPSLSALVRTPALPPISTPMEE